MQRAVIDEFGPEILISLHEAPSPGFLIHPGLHLFPELAAKILASVEEQGIELAIKDYLGRTLAAPGQSSVTGALKMLKNLIAVQSLGDYVAPKGIVEITTESEWGSDDNFLLAAFEN